MIRRYRIFILFIILVFCFVLLVEYNRRTDALKEIIDSLGRSGTAKSLVIGRANDSISLDPAVTFELDSFRVTVNIFETLVKYEKGGSRIIPCLSESWKTSEDGLTWVFKLRQGIYFHDGTPFNAQAAEFNFHRWMDTSNPYHIGQFTYWNYIFGAFPGFVKSVNALSDYTLEIRLTKPYAPFLNALAMPVFGIASPKAIQESGYKFSEHPVGTGPFYFKSWEKGKSIILSRNDKYWGGNAKVDEVEFRVIPSADERLELLRQGTIQIADDLSQDDVPDIETDPNLQLYLRPCFNVGYIAMNNEKTPFDNRDVRLAVDMAVSKEQLIKDVFADLAKPAKSLVPPLLWAYNDAIESHEYNPEKAKELLKKAGYPNGFKTTLWVMNGPRNYFPKPMMVAQYIQDSLRQVGIDADIESLNWDVYLKRIDRGEHELALIGWTGDNIDPDNFLYTLLSSDNAKPGTTGNYSFYRNKEVDRLLVQARQTTNMAFRNSLYERVLKIVDYDMPSIPLVHTMPVLAARLSIRGYEPYMTGVESLERVDIYLD